MQRIFSNLVLSTLFLCASLCFSSSSAVTAQEAAPGYEKNSEHTLKLADGAASPPAKIADVAWIAGHWRGKAFGGTVEEVWAPPIGNSMLGMFRLVLPDGAVRFMEILTLTEEDGTLFLRLKHFNSDLTGWEEKDESIEFRFVKVEGQTVWFEGMTFQRVDKDTLNIYVTNQNDDGTLSEFDFTLTAF